MADRTKSAALGAKSVKPKRPSTTNVATSSRTKIASKDKLPTSRPKKDLDTTLLNKEQVLPDFDDEYRQIAYGRFMRAMLEECLVEEKIDREETQMDLQMAQLAERFQKTMDQLDKTNRRLKDISFVVEQKSLYNLKNNDCEQFYQMTDDSNAEMLLKDLAAAEQPILDKIELRNVDFGYNNTSGHKQLLDAVNDAIEGLTNIKKESKLDPQKFEEYEHSKQNIEELESDKFDLESLKSEFEAKFPKFSERLIQEASEKIAKMIENDEKSSELSRQLDLWLSKADLTHGPARAIIAPHAGYSYCGACAGFAYRQVSPVVVKRIFILGPSHHVRLGGCALSSLDKYQTPLYDLTIDKQIYAELEASRQFEWMDVQTDEDEHSIEMHLPYIAKVMEEFQTAFTIIPILVGSLTPEKEAKYGAILAPYLADPQNLFVISSDFCHWGNRFRYTWKDSSRGPIHQSIEWLDKQGMDIIEKMDPRAFTEYLNKYGNTICGRHPIGVLLNAIVKLRSQTNSPRMSMKFLKYAQSSQCTSMQDSSVSYASASLVFE
ncbi:unnamed protein product [Arctia plantaginis]|uniref:Protein MEMO1 n=1 Tax=Arctia plantaginis TaxID=874455 RepID=A0A8S1BI67_ARCPL|nr:unnamed protein product [Arctia plantaginis]